MLDGKVLVYSDFGAYKRYRSEEPIAFVPWELKLAE